VAAPIEGVVVDVNDSLVRNPGAAVSNPYGDGWLFRVMSESLPLPLLLSGQRAAEWFAHQAERARAFFLAHAPRVEFATLQDGGTPVDGVLKTFDERVWREFERQFLRLDPRTNEEGEHHHA
jgi:hypothetical protein